MWLSLLANAMDLILIIIYYSLNDNILNYLQYLIDLFVLIPALVLIILAMKKCGYSRQAKDLYSFILICAVLMNVNKEEKDFDNVSMCQGYIVCLLVTICS